MDARTEPAIDAGAWRGLEELREALRSFLARHCQDENELDDVIQETFVRAARYRSGRRGVLRLKAWTMRIALNVLSDWKRRGGRIQALPLEDEVFEQAAAERTVLDEGTFLVGRWQVDCEAARELLQTTREKRRDRDRALLDAFYGGLRCSRAAALQCGIPRHLVKIRLFRARQRLLRALRRRVALEERWGTVAS